MRTPMLLAMLFASFIGSSQNWLPFDTAATKAVFTIENNTSISDTPAVSLAANDLIQLRLHDSLASGKHYLSTDKIKGCSIFDPSSDCFEQMESCQDYFSWVGDPVITQAWDSYLSVNRWGDTLTLPNTDEDSTLAWTKGDTTYYFVKTDMVDTTIDGFSDSVALFSIAMEVNEIATANADWDNEEIVFSKSKGMIALPMWYLFPYEKSMVNRYKVDEENPVSYNSFFKYEVGDEIDFIRTWEAGTFGIGQGLISVDEDSESRYGCIVSAVGQDVSGNKTFDLDCEVVHTEWIYEYFNGTSSSNPIGYDITSDTTAELWTKTSQDGFALDGVLKQSVFMNLDGTEVNVSRAEVTSGSQSTQGCPLYEFIFEPWTQNNWDFKSDLGLIHHSSSVANDGSGSYYQSSFTLAYYNGVNGTYGTPLIIAGEEETQSSTSVSIFPNPTSGLVNITTDAIVSQVQVFDQSGRMVQQMQNPASTIDLQSLEAGIYFMILELENGKQTSQKFVIAR